jgi:hypothetical protein
VQDDATAAPPGLFQPFCGRPDRLSGRRRPALNANNAKT